MLLGICLGGLFSCLTPSAARPYCSGNGLFCSLIRHQGRGWTTCSRTCWEAAAAHQLLLMGSVPWSLMSVCFCCSAEEAAEVFKRLAGEAGLQLQEVPTKDGELDV